MIACGAEIPALVFIIFPMDKFVVDIFDIAHVATVPADVSGTEADGFVFPVFRFVIACGAFDPAFRIIVFLDQFTVMHDDIHVAHISALETYVRLGAGGVMRIPGTSSFLATIVANLPAFGFVVFRMGGPMGYLRNRSLVATPATYIGRGTPRCVVRILVMLQPLTARGPNRPTLRLVVPPGGLCVLHSCDGAYIAAPRADCRCSAGGSMVKTG